MNTTSDSASLKLVHRSDCTWSVRALRHLMNRSSSCAQTRSPREGFFSGAIQTSVMYSLVLRQKESVASTFGSRSTSSKIGQHT
jgi:hypothetical protein